MDGGGQGGAHRGAGRALDVQAFYDTLAELRQTMTAAAEAEDAPAATDAPVETGTPVPTATPVG